MSTIVKDNNKNYLAIAFKHLLTALPSTSHQATLKMPTT